jgi:caffeoyl-CoA O-methyltransferase
MNSPSQKFFGQSDPKVVAYAERTFVPEDPLLKDVRLRAQLAGLPGIHVGAFDGLHLEVLTRATQPTKIVEIGTLAGYSGVRLARALREGGKLYTFEIDARHAEVARETFTKAGFADRAEFFVGPAIEKLHQISDQAPFDLVFIDADKESYPHYLEWAIDRVRVGGLIIGDNTFGWGMIADETFTDAEDKRSIEALRAFNQRLASDPRYVTTILPTHEGLTVAVRKS